MRIQAHRQSGPDLMRLQTGGSRRRRRRTGVGGKIGVAILWNTLGNREIKRSAAEINPAFPPRGEECRKLGKGMWNKTSTWRSIIKNVTRFWDVCAGDLIIELNHSWIRLCVFHAIDTNLLKFRRNCDYSIFFGGRVNCIFFSFFLKGERRVERSLELVFLLDVWLFRFFNFFRKFSIFFFSWFGVSWGCDFISVSFS